MPDQIRDKLVATGLVWLVVNPKTRQIPTFWSDYYRHFVDLVNPKSMREKEKELYLYRKLCFAYTKDEHLAIIKKKKARNKGKTKETTFFEEVMVAPTLVRNPGNIHLAKPYWELCRNVQRSCAPSNGLKTRVSHSASIPGLNYKTNAFGTECNHQMIASSTLK